ncbi:MAG TPA: DUF2017 family protein [Verrucomicrobiae bacterium]|nr:DUF2017 family protein [Verrucomicrobiae bacterium]
MIDLSIQQLDEKRILISGIPPVLAAMLREIPEILELRDSTEARARLYPNPTAGDDKINREWHQMMQPELRHLFVSAGETVGRDLTAMTADKEAGESWQVAFPIEHVSAWMSAINQTRLILGEIHKIDEEGMNRTDFNPRSAKDMAALRIHMLGYLLHQFVELGGDDGSEDHI